jgi:hypothetical protein
MPEPAEDMIVRNLIEALGRLHEDLDRMELWAAALGSFAHPVPDYQPSERQLLAPARKRQRRHERRHERRAAGG